MLKAPNGPGHKDGLDGGPTFSKKLARLNAQCGWINSVANLLAILAFSHTTFRCNILLTKMEQKLWRIFASLFYVSCEFLKEFFYMN